MREKVDSMVSALNQFINEVEALDKHPYGKGVDVAAVCADLRNFLKQFTEDLDKVEEDKDEETANTETEKE